VSTCGKCKRTLKDPRSIERGFGPVCWGAVQAEKRVDPADESDYDYRIDQSDTPVLVITDLNRGRLSVTNNIEAILRRIAANEEIDLKTITIIYKDSESFFDGVHVSEDGAVNLFPITVTRSLIERTTNEQEAIQAVRGKS